jgi:hypothetical protein
MPAKTSKLPISGTSALSMCDDKLDERTEPNRMSIESKAKPNHIQLSADFRAWSKTILP